MKKHIFGALLCMEGMFLLLTLLVSLIYCEADWWVYLLCAGICFAIGGGCITVSLLQKTHSRFTRADSFLVVTLAWIIFSAIGMIPFILIYHIDVSGAFFETISGFTTTGSTVISDIESMTHALKFWRSLTQWMGGLGIVVFSFALIPTGEMKNNNIFSAEATGIGLDKIRPKIGSTARRLLVIYIALTTACAALYYAGPMNLYDSICHSLTTISTGGFSTHNTSIAYFHSAYIEYVCSVFMILSSINFSLFYYACIRKWKIISDNEEMNAFLAIVVAGIAIIIALFYTIPQTAAGSSLPHGIEETFRTALFHVSTIISTTGFAATKCDYVAWGAPFCTITLLLMIIGGCAGSTAGGIKVVRVLVSAKRIKNEFIKQLHPRAVLGIKLNHAIVSDERIRRSMTFLIIFAILVATGTILLSFMGIDLETSLGSCITSLGNIGPATGPCGPTGNFAEMPDIAKWLLSFLMLVGRLEIYTVLFLFMPGFWKMKG